MRSMAAVVSIQVGKPRRIDGEWESGFIKTPVDGPVWLGVTNLDGDGQADLKHHGGPDQAVLVYAAEHYPTWRVELGRPDLPYGAFAENVTVSGLTEARVCIGDVYALGGAKVQVTQPRTPCWKLSRRWETEGLTVQVQQTGRTGWYLRVLSEGFVEPGAAVVLRERSYPDWTVTRAAQVMRSCREDPAAAAGLQAVGPLSERWKTTLARVLKKV